MDKVVDFVKQVFGGKSIYRILFNWQVKACCKDLSGEVLDLAAGNKPSYYKYFPRDLKVIKTDINKNKNVDIKVDLNKKLPFADKSFKNILFFNSLYIIKDRKFFFDELFRILSDDGRLFISSLFIANEMREPDDFCRLTYQGLTTELGEAGFNRIRIIRIGERFSASVHLLYPFFFFNFVRLFVFPLCLLFDRLVPRRIRQNHPCPIGYFCVIEKY